MRPAEGEELLWEDPVEVAVLDFFVVFVFVDVEAVEVEEAVEEGLVEAVEAVEQGEVVGGAAEGGVSEWQEGRI